MTRYNSSYEWAANGRCGQASAPAMYETFAVPSLAPRDPSVSNHANTPMRGGANHEITKYPLLIFRHTIVTMQVILTWGEDPGRTTRGSETHFGPSRSPGWACNKWNTDDYYQRHFIEVLARLRWFMLAALSTPTKLTTTERRVQRDFTSKSTTVQHGEAAGLSHARNPERFKSCDTPSEERIRLARPEK